MIGLGKLLGVVKTSPTDPTIDHQSQCKVQVSMDSTTVIAVGFMAGFITGVCIALWSRRRKARAPSARGPQQPQPTL